MRWKILYSVGLCFILAVSSCAEPKTALIKFSRELTPIEISHHQLNNWWNVYVARERVPHYEVPLHILRIELYKNQLEALNTRLQQLQAPRELAHVKVLLLEVYAKRLTYSTLAITCYRLGDEQGLVEVDKGIDEANLQHGEALKEWMRVLEKYGISLEEIAEKELQETRK